MFIFVQKHEFDVLNKKWLKHKLAFLCEWFYYDKVNLCTLNIIDFVAVYFYLQRNTMQLRFEASKHTIHIWSKQWIDCKRLKH